MAEIERLRTSVETLVASAPAVVFGLCVACIVLWFAWYIVRGRP